MSESFAKTKQARMESEGPTCHLVMICHGHQATVKLRQGAECSMVAWAGGPFCFPPKYHTCPNFFFLCFDWKAQLSFLAPHSHIPNALLWLLIFFFLRAIPTLHGQVSLIKSISPPFKDLNRPNDYLKIITILVEPRLIFIKVTTQRKNRAKHD